MLVRTYRCLKMNEARHVLLGGEFVDVDGPDHVGRGVWITDRPWEQLCSDRVGSFDLALTIDGLRESELVGFEWLDSSKLYREWLVPASMINGRCTVSVETNQQLNG